MSGDHWLDLQLIFKSGIAIFSVAAGSAIMLTIGMLDSHHGGQDSDWVQVWALILVSDVCPKTA